MSSDTVIRIENLGKRYRLGTITQAYDTLRDAAVRWFRSTTAGETKKNDEENYIWALKDINLEIKQGEVLGVIGRNGAGKSTLLKILSRITTPTTGRVKLKGRVGTLLEVGTGFHPELTGRENIFMNGAILGMTRVEIKRRFDEIVSFAEVEKFLDTPVKRYSSGMYVRLAFAVAAHLDPEILVVDEVLAVGDFAFQKKCLSKMESVSKKGRTVLFVSHNMAAISTLCTKAILLHGGSLFSHGPVDIIKHEYVRMLSQISVQPLKKRTDRTGGRKLRFNSIQFFDKEGQQCPSLETGKDYQIEIDFEYDTSSIHFPDVTLSMVFNSVFGTPLLLCRNDYSGDQFPKSKNYHKAVCTIPCFPLVPGAYDINLYAEMKGEVLDWVQAAMKVDVVEGDFYGTGKLPPRGHVSVLVKHHWELK